MNTVLFSQKKSHKEFPEEYDVCVETGLHFFKRAVQREYTENYFLDEFKQQYQKTYYEDEQNLRKLAENRLNVLSRFLVPEGKSLLEIGSAAGFFLDEAKKKGFKTKGIEISKSEVEYSRKLGLDVDCISFLDFETNQKYNLVVAFFVIEHFQEQEKVFHKINSLLDKGGFLFLGLPSLYGPTYKTNPKNWFEFHPKDHFVDFSPKSLTSILDKLKFTIVFKEPMSYHSGRDLGWRGVRPFKYFYNKLAKWTCYGDTMQVLARKR
jgi:2-polyprenyl-3-methyl-5-hydroxy-6-metoxy-1,4-benzoquinol methylase